MKTLEQIKKHLEETSYTEKSQDEIFAYLCGRFPERDFGIECKEPPTFEDFLEWVESNDEKVQCTSSINYSSKNVDLSDYFKKDADIIKYPRYKYIGEERARLERLKFELSYWNGYFKDDKIQSVIKKIEADLNETED